MRKIFIVLSLFTSGIAFAQGQHFSCTAGEKSMEQFTLHPQLLVSERALEDFTRQYVQTHQAEGRNSRAGATYIIPVVFHILHDGGSELLSDSVINIEMQHWNQYMSATNPDINNVVRSFDSLVANTQIEFRLAQKDPNGNCTNGIERIYTQATYVGTENTKMNQWPSNKYLNVWLTKGIDRDVTSYGVLAYSYTPGSIFVSSQDGILAKAAVIGTNAAFNKPTLAHESGHWANLQHTWGYTNSPGVACGDDGVSDTPPTEGSQSTCNVNLSVCNPPIIENEQNVMNYSSCHMMFTKGQATRMQAALNSSQAGRNNIWRAANLTATGTTNATPLNCGTPIADFTATKRYACAGDPIRFTDASYNATVQSRLWTFTNDADITTSTDANPTVTFYGPGWKDISLEVTNANGSTTKTKTMVYISDGTSILAPYYESFENQTNAQSNWQSVNYDNNNTSFQYYQGTGSNSTKCFKLNNYDLSYDGDKDELISPTFDMSNIAPADLKLAFDYAYSKSIASVSNDTFANLAVYASKDCGKTWAKIYTRSGTALYNNGLHNSAYTPGTTSANWKTVTLSLPVIYQNSNVVFKFQVNGLEGTNNFFIDNINIGNVIYSGIAENSLSLQSIDVIPNPVADNATLVIDAAQAATVEVKVYDIQGREVSTVYTGNISEGTREISFSTASLSTGVYFVRVSDGHSSAQKKFVKL